MKTKKIAYITQTAVMLALLIGVQFATRSLGQFVTGSLVNFTLLASVYLIGLHSGLTIAFLSPFLAFFMGIGPAFIQITPFIAIGNAILVIIAWLARRHIATPNARSVFFSSTWLITASIAKTLFLWVGLVIIALPFIPGINEKQAAIIGVSFTWPQLVTALIGSVLAVIIVPLLKRAIPSSK